MTECEIQFAGCQRENAELAEVLVPIVAGVLERGQMLQGPEVASLEATLALACGRGHAICVGSGSDALFFALIALGIEPGDEVLVPDISFIATAHAVARTGAVPIFVDVDEGCHMDFELAEQAVTSRTRAMVVVQLFGAMADPSRIRAFAEKFGLWVVEDAAQAFGAIFGSTPAGSIGDVSALSFDPMKVLSAPGSGGAVLTDQDDVAARIRRLRYHGRQEGKYVALGYNSQLPTLAAAVLLAKLQRHPYWTARRRAIASRFIEALEGLPVVQSAVDPSVTHAWHKFVIRVEERDRLAAHLKRQGIPTMVHYLRPFHREPVFGEKPDSEYPRAISHAAQTLSLPIYAQLSDQEVEWIVKSLRGFFGSE